MSDGRNDKRVGIRMSDAPALEDYVWFFESEPEWMHELGWYHGARFRFANGRDTLTVTVAPDEASLDLVWEQDGRRRLALALKMVVQWKIERRRGFEHLLLRINTGPQALCGFEYCLVRIRPQVEVECRMNWGPGWEPTPGASLDAPMPTYFVVRRLPGPGWAPDKPLRSQAMWQEHADFMNGLARERFVVLGGVIGTANHALLVVDAPDEAFVRTRLQQDPWSRNHTLVIHAIEPWDVLLGAPK